MTKKLALVLVSLLLMATVFAILPNSSLQNAALSLTSDKWWSGDWKYRIKLQFNNAETSGSLSNHRVLIRLDSNKIDYHQTQDKGEDIRFLRRGDLPRNPLPHHITHWDESGESFVFVQVPYIEESNDDYIWIYYGNPTVADGQDIDSTWSDDYRAVLPLNETTTVFKDYSNYDSDPWGNFGTPSRLGYTATNGEKSNFEGGRPLGTSVAVYNSSADRTFVVYTGGEEEYQGELFSPCDGYITYYNHATSQWATPFLLFDNPKNNFDQHHYEQILIHDNDYLHVFYGMHNDPLLHRKSSYPVTSPNWSLTSWTAIEELPDTDHATYPVAFKATNGDVYVIFRNSLLTPPENLLDWYEPEYYTKSIDNGETWATQILIDTEQRPDGWGSLYLNGAHYTANPEGIHILFTPHSRYRGQGKGEYYIFFSFSDNHVYSFDGTDLGEYVDRDEYEQSCLMYDDGTTSPYATGGAIDIDEYGYLNAIMHRDLNNNGNYQLVWMKWDGLKWTETLLPHTAASTVSHRATQLEIHSQNDIDLYVNAYENLQEVGDAVSGRVEIARYHWDGVTWQRAEVVFGKSSQNLSRLTLAPVTNGTNEFKFTIDECDLTDGWWQAKKWGRVYGYGSDGILKNSNRAETTSPVGPGVHFNGETDNIRIQHLARSGSSFTFDDDRVSVEFLVNFDNLGDTAQFPFGKSIGGKGFSCSYDGNGKLDWYIGDGSSYHHLKSSNEINANEWYYVVTTFTPKEQAVWVNGVKTSSSVDYTPDWGTNGLRLGSPSLEDCCFLDGKLGGYFAVRDTVPSNAYIKASKKNFIDKTFVSYGHPEEVDVEGDLDDDRDVDSQDLKILLANWGASPSEPRADLNGDGIVNGLDFGKMRKLIQ